MAHNNIIIAGIGFLPDNIINLILAENYSRVLCKKLENLKLRMSELYLLISPNDYTLNLINLKTFETQRMLIQTRHLNDSLSGIYQR